MSIKVDPEWWKTLFDDVYLKTDARSVCDERISSREADVICELLPLETGHRVLDLCGGQGRHSLKLLQRCNADYTVVDYSRYLLKRGLQTARERGYPVRFIQGDARRTGFSSESFDHVIIMGNSLGYLPLPDDDTKILEEAFRLAKPGSRLLVDITDGQKIKSEMVPNAWHEVDGDIVVCRQRELVNGTVRAREMVFSRKSGLIRDRSYAIRLFTPAKLEKIIHDAGFVDVCLHRDFRPHDREGDYGFMNRRILATAVKPKHRENII